MKNNSTNLFILINITMLPPRPMRSKEVRTTTIHVQTYVCNLSTYTVHESKLKYFTLGCTPYEYSGACLAITGYTNYRMKLTNIPAGSLLAASGPFARLFLPTLVGTGASIFLFFSFDMQNENVSGRLHCYNERNPEYNKWLEITHLCRYTYLFSSKKHATYIYSHTEVTMSAFLL